jgi:hypothetical protein
LFHLLIYSTFGKPPSPILENTTLADFAFLSYLAYRNDSVIDSELEQWFGPSGEVVTDEKAYVDEWNLDNPNFVSYRLFRLQKTKGSLGMVSVRGTANWIDLLVDNQLWQAAMLVQGIRAALPFGGIFTPILPSKFFCCFLCQPIFVHCFQNLP